MWLQEPSQRQWEVDLSADLKSSSQKPLGYTTDSVCLTESEHVYNLLSKEGGVVPSGVVGVVGVGVVGVAAMSISGWLCWETGTTNMRSLFLSHHSRKKFSLKDRAGESKNRVQATYTSVQISGIHVVTARELGQMVQKQLLDTENLFCSKIACILRSIHRF